MLLGQSSVASKKFLLTGSDPKVMRVTELIRMIEDRTSVTYSYNAVQFQTLSIILPDKTEITVGELTEMICKTANCKFLYREPDKIILIPEYGTDNRDWISIRGYIYDRESGESLVGALIQDQKSGSTVSSNENGYYYLRLRPGRASILIRYLGYREDPVEIDLQNNLYKNFYLDGNNRLPEIIISDKVLDRINHWNSGENMDAYRSREFKSLLGESDLINNARILPGIQSGGEGQNELLVRGGSYDQNLVLMEGIPLYESSHIGGIASFFIDETIKEASIIKNGFPARYAGRLSSVMDVQLRDGNRQHTERLVSVGMPGAKLYYNGPIAGDRLSCNIAARTSWLDYYVNNFLKKYTRYDDINLGYSDIIGKLSWFPADNQKLTLSFYNGGDRFSLERSDRVDTVGYSFNSFERSGLRWGNTLTSLQYHFNPGDRLHLSAKAGLLNYRHRSRSSYAFNTDINGTSTKDELDVLSYADIIDLQGGLHADYYLNDYHTIRTGVTFIHHRFNPVVKQSLIILEGESADIIDRDSTIRAGEWGFYVEDQILVFKDLKLYTGLHLSSFNVENKTYRSLQPRLNLLWSPAKTHLISLSYSRMTQNIHLLVNSGLGLPSDLWVPSTANIAPQHANQLSVSYSGKVFSHLYFYAGAYLKHFQNLVEYNTLPDLFYFFINDQTVVPVYNTSRDWERNLLTGTGQSRGLELMIQRKNRRVNGWLGVTWSRSRRSFGSINNGLPFPFTHDRTWDINVGISTQLSERWTLGLNGVYGTGNTFSLATEEYDSFLGIRLLNADGRNNYRLPPFVQLSFNAAYDFSISGLKAGLHFNAYNITNRLNAYYIYIYKNPLNGDSVLRKVSILPFTPSINFTLHF